MAFHERGDTRIHYTVSGDTDADVPVLLIAPGGMKSANALWANMPWNPSAALAGEHRLIGMDQRNAGASVAPVSGDDGWSTYADDQLALLDHLDVERCHVLGMCIGGPYIMGLLRRAPERFVSAVMLQPVGIEDNRQALYDMFDGWAADLAPAHPEVDQAGWTSFRSNMWDGEFVLTVTDEEAAEVETPVLLLKGNDLYHPASTSDRLAEVLPNVTYVEHWKEPEHLNAADQAIRDFLSS